MQGKMHCQKNQGGTPSSTNYRKGEEEDGAYKEEESYPVSTIKYQQVEISKSPNINTIPNEDVRRDLPCEEPSVYLHDTARSTAKYTVNDFGLIHDQRVCLHPFNASSAYKFWASDVSMMDHRVCLYQRVLDCIWTGDFSNSTDRRLC
jgi:hypothetical protein